MTVKQMGKCRLTASTGPLVRAHIIPEALTRHEEPGQPIFQAGERRRPVKRMTSWYDSTIVTAEGEAVLGRYDDWAVKALRRHRLVWSGWNGRKLLSSDLRRGPTDWSYRILEGEDWSLLRLFLLSVLWRAAVSSLPEFEEIVLPGQDVAQLGEMLVKGSADPQAFYPMRLIQLTTKGPRHNHSPIAAEMPVPLQGPILARRQRIFRFFIEGLIVHFERDIRLEGQLRSLGLTAVGVAPSLGVLGRPFEGSFQARTFGRVMLETFMDWPQMRPQILQTVAASLGRRQKFR